MWISTNRGPANLAEKTFKMTGMTFLYIIVLRNKTVAHTFLPSFDNANGRLGQERWLRSRNVSTILHLRNEKGTAVKMCPAIVSGIVTEHAPVSYWSIGQSAPKTGVQRSQKGAFAKISVAGITEWSYCKYVRTHR